MVRVRLASLTLAGSLLISSGCCGYLFDPPLMPRFRPCIGPGCCTPKSTVPVSSYPVMTPGPMGDDCACASPISSGVFHPTALAHEVPTGPMHGPAMPIMQGPPIAPPLAGMEPPPPAMMPGPSAIPPGALPPGAIPQTPPPANQPPRIIQVPPAQQTAVPIPYQPPPQ